MPPTPQESGSSSLRHGPGRVKTERFGVAGDVDFITRSVRSLIKNEDLSHQQGRDHCCQTPA
jgi:hypothetical protein